MCFTFWSTARSMLHFFVHRPKYAFCVHSWILVYIAHAQGRSAKMVRMHAMSCIQCTIMHVSSFVDNYNTSTLCIWFLLSYMSWWKHNNLTLYNINTGSVITSEQKYTNTDHVVNINSHCTLVPSEVSQSTSEGTCLSPVPLRHCPVGLCTILPLSVSSNFWAWSSPLHCIRTSWLCLLARQRVNCFSPPLEERAQPCRMNV